MKEIPSQLRREMKGSAENNAIEKKQRKNNIEV